MVGLRRRLPCRQPDGGADVRDGRLQLLNREPDVGVGVEPTEPVVDKLGERVLVLHQSPDLRAVHHLHHATPPPPPLLLRHAARSSLYHEKDEEKSSQVAATAAVGYS
jgi:hypothetical protein